MHIQTLLALLLLLVALAGGLNVGDPPRRHKSSASLLVPRGEKETPHTTQEEMLRVLKAMNFNVIAEKPGSQEPPSPRQGSSSSMHRHSSLDRTSSSQRRAKRRKPKSTSALAPEPSGWTPDPARTHMIGYDPNHVGRDVPLDPNRKNVPSKSRNTVMYHGVSPNPLYFEGVRNLKTGKEAYFRRITDAVETRATLPGRVFTSNPFQSLVTSRGQKSRYKRPRPTISKGQRQKYVLITPANHEERETTGHIGFSSRPEWHRIQPKTKKELPPGVRPWTREDLRNNLIQQLLHFKNHEAGQKTSAYAGLDKHMRDMCNTEQCQIQETSRLWGTG